MSAAALAQAPRTNTSVRTARRPVVRAATHGVAALRRRRVDGGTGRCAGKPTDWKREPRSPHARAETARHSILQESFRRHGRRQRGLRSVTVVIVVMIAVMAAPVTVIVVPLAALVTLVPVIAVVDPAARSIDVLLHAVVRGRPAILRSLDDDGWGARVAGIVWLVVVRRRHEAAGEPERQRDEGKA